MVFDEASMLDTPSVYRILSQIPSEVDLVFIGDPAQLPPIGPGLLFQSMVAAEAIPRVALDVIHRQADQTGMPGVAAMIRAGSVPAVRTFNPSAPLVPGVFIVQAVIRAIREALGMTGVQFARRLHVKPQSIDALEKSEANGAIKIETLRRAAEALDCTLVYALVPNSTLEEAVRIRARRIALRDLGRVAHTMKLEAQGTNDADLQARIDAYVRDTLRERDLWEQP